MTRADNGGCRSHLGAWHRVNASTSASAMPGAAAITMPAPPSSRPVRDPVTLGSKPALLLWGMKDFALKPKPILPRMRATFGDHVVIGLDHAGTSSRRMQPRKSPTRSLADSADKHTDSRRLGSGCRLLSRGLMNNIVPPGFGARWPTGLVPGHRWPTRWSWPTKD